MDQIGKVTRLRSGAYKVEWYKHVKYIDRDEQKKMVRYFSSIRGMINFMYSEEYNDGTINPTIIDYLETASV